jgi:hypothetical protein
MAPSPPVTHHTPFVQILLAFPSPSHVTFTNASRKRGATANKRRVRRVSMMATTTRILPHEELPDTQGTLGARGGEGGVIGEFLLVQET